MVKRSIGAIAIVAIVLPALLQGGLWFIALVLVCALLMFKEVEQLLPEYTQPHHMFLRVLYVVIPCISIIALRTIDSAEVPYAGLKLTLYVLGIIIATDIGAYAVGKTLGGPKLLPSISPNKTWSGLFGGVVAAMVLSMASIVYTPFPDNITEAVMVGILLALIAQAGDFFESWMKRVSGVKDSGTILPGHGGLLDRLDGYMFAVPFFVILVSFSTS